MPGWFEILVGAAFAALVIFFAPSALRWAKNSPKGSTKDWLGLLIPLGGVVLFIILLVALARG